MDKLWKWVMHLNAKAFCLLAAVLFLAVSAYCAFQVKMPPPPLKDGHEDNLPDLAAAWTFGTLDVVSNQLAAESLSIPVDPFRPTIEAIFTNETERAAFLKALKAAQIAAAGGLAEGAAKKEDPFAHLRKKEAVPGGLVGPNGQPMVIPKLTFLGFFERPDGTKTAMFHDSVKDTTVFYDTGNKVHGVDVVNADVRSAEIRFPDGKTRAMEIGSSIELEAEPDTRPPKKAPPAAAKPAAGAQKPGAGALKPGAKPGAAAQQKQAAKPAAQQAQKAGRPLDKQERPNKPEKAKRAQAAAPAG